MSHEIPEDVSGLWYKGQPYVFLKINTTEPSSALRNAAELKSVLIARYGNLHSMLLIIRLCTDGGPEHRTTFLSVLQKSLNADMIVALRTAPGHSYRNPPGRVSCILNIGLYGIGAMRKRLSVKPEFKRKLSQCSNIDEVCQLIR